MSSFKAGNNGMTSDQLGDGSFLPKLGRAASASAGALQPQSSLRGSAAPPRRDTSDDDKPSRQLAAVQRNYAALSKVVGVKQQELSQVRPLRRRPQRLPSPL